jgi:hypothetical protein
MTGERKESEIVSIRKGDIARYVVLGLVIVLLTVSVVQAYQISELKEDIVNGPSFVISSGDRTSGSTAQLAAQVQVPAMVGGC